MGCRTRERLENHRSQELEAAESCGQGGESGDRLLLMLGGEGKAERWNRGDASILVHRI